MKIRDKFELIYLKEIIRNIFNVQTKSFHNGSPLIAVLLPKLNWFNSSINRRNYEIFKCNYQASTDTKTEECSQKRKKSFVKSTSFRSRCAENEKYHMKLTPPRAGKPPQPP